MNQISSTELSRKLGEVLSQAKREPVTVTSHGREEVVIVDVEYFNRLKQYVLARRSTPMSLATN